MSKTWPSCQRSRARWAKDDEDVGVVGDALGVKGRLHQAPLTAVEVAFAGEEAFAEGDLGEAEGGAFCEVFGVGDGDVADVVGVTEEVDAASADAEMGDVAVVAVDFGKKADDVPPHPVEDAPGPNLEGPGTRWRGAERV